MTGVVEWLTLGAATASAIFAGLVWWQQRRGVRYESVMTGPPHRDGHLPITITVTNERDRALVVESISVEAPVAIVAGSNGARYGHHVPAGAPIQLLSKVQENKHVKADAEPEAFNMLLAREGGFEFRAIGFRLAPRPRKPAAAP